MPQTQTTQFPGEGVVCALMLGVRRRTGPAACGSPDTIDKLIDAGSRANIFSDISPAALFPLGVGQIIVSGKLGPIVAPKFADAYAAKIKAARYPIQQMTVGDAGHFELIDSASDAWSKIEPGIEAMLK